MFVHVMKATSGWKLKTQMQKRSYNKSQSSTAF